MKEIMKVTGKRHIAVLTLLSDIDTDDRLHAVKVVKTIKGMAWVIMQKFAKYSWSRKEMTAARKWAKEMRDSRLFIGSYYQCAFDELAMSFNETLYFNLRELS